LASFSRERFSDTVGRNLTALEKILRYNLEQNFLFFRISSNTIPFATHPVNHINWKRHFSSDLARIGCFIRAHGFRISMHPDQFVLINTPSRQILDRSLADLKYHASFLDALGLDQTAKIQIHVGGIYGDKPSAMARFINVYKTLPEAIKKRLVIENDDRLYSLKDCLELNAQTGVPVLFDNFHHECLNNGESVLGALQDAAATWKSSDGVQMVDYSEQEPRARRGRHAETLSPELFRAFISQTSRIDKDIMLEIKDKEKSAEKAMEVLANQ
jgi:UV DNA damage endonuclease